MKDLLCEVQTSAALEYSRSVKKFGEANNSPHESYAVILEEFEESETERQYFKNMIEGYWEKVKRNMETENMLGEMMLIAERAAAEWIQVAAMCFKATKEPGGTE